MRLANRWILVRIDREHENYYEISILWILIWHESLKFDTEQVWTLGIRYQSLAKFDSFMKSFTRNENEFNHWDSRLLNLAKLKLIAERVCINTFAAVDE